MATARASSSIVDYCGLCSSMIDFVFMNINSIWIMSICTCVITRTEDPYTLVHLDATVNEADPKSLAVFTSYHSIPRRVVSP